jgi:hypothetical protein
MAQAVQTKQQEPDGRWPRLMHHPRAAWWFCLLALAGVAQAAFFLVLATAYSVYMVTILDRKHPSETEAVLILALSLAMAVAVGVYLYRNEKELEPPRKRIPRKRWATYANGTGAVVFIGSAYALYWLWAIVLTIAVRSARLVLPIPHLDGAAFFYLTTSIPLVLAWWGFVAWRHAQLRLLETAQPPEMRLVTNVIRCADEFQERAKTLERAMEDATEVSKQVQRGIESEKQQLAELREQYLQVVHLKDLTDEEVAAVRAELAEDNARERRWSVWFNLMIVLVGWAIGVLTDALIDNEALGEQLCQWFHLG